MFSYFFGLAAFAQPKEILISQVEEVLKNDPKPVVIFLHTKWCSYCTLMERKTFKNEEVVSKLNSDFYFISFDAEQEEDIVFHNQTYSFRKKGINGGVHDLANLLSGKEAYPALIFLNEKLEKVYEHNAYIRPDDLSKLLELL
ncbi:MULTISPECIES: thioredoxin family protein [Myroides]|nr:MULTISPECIES: thioredoxin family protein [Myroides]UVD81154.1 thioredoxin family protein [Myroides albus]